MITPPLPDLELPVGEWEATAPGLIIRLTFAEELDDSIIPPTSDFVLTGIGVPELPADEAYVVDDTVFVLRWLTGDPPTGTLELDYTSTINRITGLSGKTCPDFLDLLVPPIED